jgi:hypothetical protein
MALKTALQGSGVNTHDVSHFIIISATIMACLLSDTVDTQTHTTQHPSVDTQTHTTQHLSSGPTKYELS